MECIGIDEAGRGAWAGPLVAGAVVVSGAFQDMPLLNDSKKLSAKARERLYAAITASCRYGVGVVSNQEIEEVGLTVATTRAMRRALEALDTGSLPIIIDGNIAYLRDTPFSERSTERIGADASVPSVMAASIVAKVTRDRLMIAFAQEYPEYGFERHVGYGTSEHRKALQDYGITAIHRRNYRPVLAIV